MKAKRPSISLEQFYDAEISSRHRAKIPARAKIEKSFPVEQVLPLALQEGNAKKPVYQIHKWWARRLGSNFRLFLLASVMASRGRHKSLWRDFYGGRRLSNIVVFDPFMGGGTSVVEALKLGARVIGCDIDPVAWLVTKKEVEPCDRTLVAQHLREVLADAQRLVGKFYKTKDPAGHECDSVNYFWVDQPTCPTCKTLFEAHPHYIIEEGLNDGIRTVFCKSCSEIGHVPIIQREFTCTQQHVTLVDEGCASGGNVRCPHGHEFSYEDLPKRSKPIPKTLFAIEYSCDTCKTRAYKQPNAEDLHLLQEVDATLAERDPTLPYPRHAIPNEDRSDPRPIPFGYTHYHQLFTKRQLLTLGTLFARIKAVQDQHVREYLLLAFSDSLASNNIFCYYAFGYQKLTPLFGLHAFVPMNRTVEGNLLATDLGRGSFPKCVEKLLRGKAYCEDAYEVLPRDSITNWRGGRFRKVYTGETILAQTTGQFSDWSRGKAQALLLNQNSENLHGLPKQCVDLILTDPPYYDNLPYSEYSDFFFAWLQDAFPQLKGSPGHHTPYRQSLFVDDDPQRFAATDGSFRDGFIRVFRECRRVLRPGGIMVFTYHHNRTEAWRHLAAAVIEGRFKVSNVFPVRSEGRSGFHSYQGSIKWDAVFTLRAATSREPVSRKSRRPIDGRSAAGARRWAASRAKAWTQRLHGKDFSLADADSLRHALIAARVTQLGLKPAKARQIMEEAFASEAAAIRLREQGVRARARAHAKATAPHDAPVPPAPVAEAIAQAPLSASKRTLKRPSTRGSLDAA